MFDDTFRRWAKAEPEPFWAWVHGRTEPATPLAFERWEDARRLPTPGGTDRTDDLVAVLRRTDETEAPPVYQIVEVQTEPDPLIFFRLGNYELLFAAEKAADGGFEVGTVLIHLTGTTPTAGLQLGVRGTGQRHTVEPSVVDLRSLDAARTLRDVEAGKFGRSILALVPLMQGGGDPALVEEWKRVATTEPDEERRRSYRDVALVFAELTRGLVNWQRGLEGWEVQESQYIKGWMNEGRQRGIVEARRADVLRTLQVRFQGPVPESVRLAVEGTNDVATLDRWFDSALTANTLAEFRAAMPLDN